MLTVKGKVENGKIHALEPIAESYEGSEVTITLPDELGAENKDDWQRLFDVLEENQIDGEITDLAHQHDYYLYGTDKRD